MATMTPQQLMEALQASAGQQKTFADKLAENRVAKQGNIEKFQQQYGNTSYQSNGVALAPSQVMGGASALNQTYKDVLSPYSPELEQKARTAESDILSQIYQLQQADKKIQDTTGTTIDDLLKKQKSLKDAGYDTSAIDKTIEETYGIKKTPEADTVIGKIEDKKARADAAAYSAYIMDLKNVKDKLTGGGLISDIKTGQTGPLSAMLGQYGAGADVRTAIDSLAAKVKNKVYGAAVSEGEQKDAKRWLPSSASQETQNIKRIDAQLESKKNELTSLLRQQGLSEPEIQTYMNKMMIGEAKNVTTPTTSSTIPQPGSSPAGAQKDTLGIL